jgi:hypothetical protein
MADDTHPNIDVGITLTDSHQRSFPLSITISETLDHKGFGDKFVASILLPNDYSSPYKDSIIHKVPTILSIEIRLFKHTDPSYIHIDLFYSTYYKKQNLLNDSERLVFKSIGKILFCATFQYIHYRYPVFNQSPERTIVSLDAHSQIGIPFSSLYNVCSFYGIHLTDYLKTYGIDIGPLSPDPSHEELKAHNRILLEFIQSRYPHQLSEKDTIITLIRKNNHKALYVSLTNLLCKIISNHMLVKYYERYGFEVYGDNPDQTVIQMKTTLQTILERCHRNQSGYKIKQIKRDTVKQELSNCKFESNSCEKAKQEVNNIKCKEIICTF